MKEQKIKSRSILFTYPSDDAWDLNIHLILGEHNNYVIDTGLGTKSMIPIMKYINADLPIVVVNTHYHWDHIWGNSVFSDCTIISHSLCREIIDSEWDGMLTENEHYVYGRAEKCLPNLVFEQEIYFPEDEIRIFYTPGHTIDSISVLDEKDKVLNFGDNVGDNLEEIVPSISCTKEQYIDTLKKVKTYDFDTCISGHNIVLDKNVIDEILRLV